MNEELSDKDQEDLKKMHLESEEPKPDGHLVVRYFSGADATFHFSEVRSHTVDVISCMYIVKLTGDEYTYVQIPMMNIMMILVKVNSDEYITQQYAKKMQDDIEEALKGMTNNGDEG